MSRTPQAPDRISVARTRRPTWALVACACTVWLGGLGLLFLGGGYLLEQARRRLVATAREVQDDHLVRVERRRHLHQVGDGADVAAVLGVVLTDDRVVDPLEVVEVDDQTWMTAVSIQGAYFVLADIAEAFDVPAPAKS